MQELPGDESVAPLEGLRVFLDQRIQLLIESGFVRGCLMSNLGMEVADQSELIRDLLATHFRTEFVVNTRVHFWV